MSRRNQRQTLAALRRAAPHPLLPAAVRPVAAALLASCVAVTAILGAWLAHQTRGEWLDDAVDSRFMASLGSHWTVLDHLERLGGPIPVTSMTAALLLACVLTRRWRGAALLTIAVPAAAALTEFALKPLIGRTLAGDLSFPSGHTTGVFAVAASVAVLLIDPPRWRIPAALRAFLALSALAVATAVAIALVSLHIHYFTDTVGGAAVGAGVVLATAFILDSFMSGSNDGHSRSHPPAPARAAPDTPAAPESRASAGP
jgi:membrane-associated phospholipid phosphatase